MEKLVAISTNGNGVALVKNISEQEYKKLLNEQEKEKNEQELKFRALSECIDRNSQNIYKLKNRDILLAKSIYDNFVDMGLIDNDNDFQKMWFDFYFNEFELDLDKAPFEYKKILEKVGNL